MNTSVEHWRSLFTKGEKVLVTGASGWFGISAMKLLMQTEAQVMPVSSDGRRVDFKGVSFDSLQWDQKLIENFQPTTIFDFAFLTREKLRDLPEAEYVDVNHKLMERTFWALRLGSASRVIGLSSGASMNSSSARSPKARDIYGELKAEYEEKFLEKQNELLFSGKLIRAWSVSGKYCTKPESFAFSSFIEQAQAGKVDILSKRKVFRRYVSIDDVLTVALLSATTEPTVLETGGELLELGELAEKIVEYLNPNAVIQRTLDLSLEPDSYHSDNTSWKAAIALSNYMETSLANQILNCA